MVATLKDGGQLPPLNERLIVHKTTDTTFMGYVIYCIEQSCSAVTHVDGRFTDIGK